MKYNKISYSYFGHVCFFGKFVNYFNDVSFVI